MLDELLGRATLKERIEELEAEVERLEARYEAEAGRRAEAVRDRQAADERVNRLEDRIADLEGQLERAQGDETTPTVRGAERLRGKRLAEVLDRLTSFRTGPEGAFTAVVVDAVPVAVQEAFGSRGALIRRVAPCLAVTDDAGLVSAALEPALPPSPFEEWGDRFRIDRDWFLPAGELTLALVRSDLFAMGTYDGNDRTTFEGFESDVQADHSKGGFSQARFERRRDDQIDVHLDRCREAIKAKEAERLIVVGERTLLGEFAEAAIATTAVDATGDPEAALDDAFEAFFSATLHIL